MQFFDLLDKENDDEPITSPSPETPESLLVNSRLPAIRALRAILETNFCPECRRGRDSNAVIRAAEALLNRSGLGPTATVRVTHETSDGRSHAEWADQFEEIGLECLRRARIYRQQQPKLLPS